MKPVENPTKYFMRQAEQPDDSYKQQIQEFTSKFFDKKRCILCKEQYNLQQKIPRILIHCGHTFCTPCLTQFYQNERIRCPMCLKLIKNITNINLLPINHGIFTEIVQKNLQECEQNGRVAQIKDAQDYLFTQFQRSRKQALSQRNPPIVEPNSGLPYCILHPDRVEHFFCAPHQSAGCRTCVQVGHTRSNCKVIDLYEIDNNSQLFRNNEISNNI